MSYDDSTQPTTVTLKTRSSLRPPKVNPSEAPVLLQDLASSLAAMRAYATARHSLAHGQLTARQRQQISLTVAEINGCGSWKSNGVSDNHDAPLSETEIELARKAAAQDAREDVMLHFTQAVVLHRGAIRDKDLRAVRSAGFSESEIVEIVANIALNIFTDYLASIARAETFAAEQPSLIFGTRTAR